MGQSITDSNKNVQESIMHLAGTLQTLVVNMTNGGNPAPRQKMPDQPPQQTGQVNYENQTQERRNAAINRPSEKDHNNMETTDENKEENCEKYDEQDR